MSAMQLPTVHIVVLNWNGLADTLRCIESLERLDYANRRIVVVDNGSTDGSVERLRALGGRIRLVENGANLGYAGGNNRAMAEAFERGADLVWLFNNDAEAEQQSLCRLVAAWQAMPDGGLVSPLIRDDDEGRAVQSACGLFDIGAASYTPTADEAQARAWLAAHPERIGLVGAAMLVPRAVYERIGGLDERLFAYWEDYDYSIRSALAGFRNILVFEADVLHRAKPPAVDVAALRPHYYYFMSRNEIMMWRKFCARGRFLKFLVWVVRQRLVLVERLSGNPAVCDAILAGLWHGIRGVGGPFDPRRRMPLALRVPASRHPRFWVRVIDAVT